MSNIKFWNEDEQRTFDSWRELAEAQPWALIDPESLSNAQRETLIAEMESHAAPVTVKSGDERAEMLTDPFDPKAPALARFTAKNLPRLRPAPDLLEMAESEAASFLGRELGAFNGLTRTFVQRRGRKWKAVTPKPGQRTQCEQLPFLYTINLALRLSPVWHAVAILVEAADARRAAAAGDVQTAMRHAFLAGESRKALAVKTAKAEVAGAGGSMRKGMNSERDEKIRAAAVAMREHNPSLSNHRIAELLAESGKHGIAERTIRRIISESAA